MSVDSNGLIVAKLKQDLKFRGYKCFKPGRPSAIYQRFDYLESHCKFYKDISIPKSLSNNELLRFSKNKPVKENLETVPEKIFKHETPFTLIEDPLNTHRTVSSETTLVSEVPNIIDKENVL